MKTSPSRTPSIRSASSVFQLPATLLTFVAALTISPSAFAQVDGNWNVDLAGNWSAASNWSSTPTVPGGIGSVVNLTFDITNNSAVTIDTTSRTVGTLTIGDPVAPIKSYYLLASGGATLIMDNGGAGAVINYLGFGFDEISAPIVLNDTLTVNSSASGASVRIKGGITGTGSVTFNTGSGPNAAGGNTTTGGITGINNIGTITNSGSGVGITSLLAVGSNVTDVIQNSATSALYLNGINAYTGSTIINSGQLRLNGAGSILSSSPLVLGGGTLNSLQTAGSTQAFASTTVNRGFSTVTNGTATNTVALGAITRSTGGLLNISSLTGTTTTANTTDSSGILGTWITTGTGTSLRYASGGNGGVITAHISTVAAANLSDVTSATTNYSFAANATQTGNITGNTLQYIGSAAAAWNTGNFGVTLNGLMNGGNNSLTQTGTGIITIGSNKELVILSNNNRAISLASAIADNGGGASAITYGGPSAGVLTLTGGNTYTGGTNIASGTLQLGNNTTTGSLSATGAIVNNGVFIIKRSNAVAQGTDFSSAAITGTGAFTQAGTGTTTLNALNTYTGATTISAGTLALGAANRIADTSNLVMAGGTFATGGFSETLGTLTLSASSIIDLGSGTSALIFADSSGTTWGSSISLSFINFTAGTDSIRIGTSNLGLTSGQLSQITINGLAAIIDSSGYLVSAIPEPSTYAIFAGAGMLIFAGVRRKARGSRTL
ncbi:beta strand repeat-containing protein [Rariglobus hedericola]|uniref:PEP-CTERM sorting domain-containing protein n=1 Tax=Rariglobus hedericola TaxID=2597822 RepID=A0A556QSD3_9BACT|nr:autotransporter-associated beta strand repeat-containing protein [Rariglobus hedericola]TSJ79554.1 hypothetical protein FPL22_09790 [Rariglobus hedericola]